MTPPTRLRFMLGAAMLMGGTGCHVHSAVPAARHTAALSQASTAHHSSQAAAQAPPDDVPPPPAAHSDPLSREETRLTHPSGASVCAQERPELADVVLTVDLTSYTAPEHRVLLRAWLTRSLAPLLGAAGGEASAHPPPGCGAHLFCSVLPPQVAEQAVDRLADFFNGPQLQSFSTARGDAMEQVEELYQRSAVFRLHALAEGLFTGRIDKSSATSPKLLDVVLGPTALSALTPAAVHQALVSQLHNTHVAIFAPRGAQSLAQRLLDRLRLTASGARARVFAYVPSPSIRITDERYPEAQLLLTWPTLAPAHQGAAQAALARLADKIKASHPGVLVLMDREDGITPRPALRLAASWNELVQLAPELDGWGARLGGVPFAGPPGNSPAPACALQALPTHTPSASAPTWGRPQLILWGAEHAPSTEEQL